MNWMTSAIKEIDERPLKTISQVSPEKNGVIPYQVS